MTSNSRILILATSLFFAFSLLNSCSVEKGITQKWLNTKTTIQNSDLKNTDGNFNSSIIYPEGFFSLRSDHDYQVLSQNVPQKGPWRINKNHLILDGGTPHERVFKILKASADSLIIERKVGSNIYSQYYQVYKCPSKVQLTKQWDNIDILTSYTNEEGNALAHTYHQYPKGYFQLRDDMTYSVYSNGVPQNGVWRLGSVGKLILDPSTPGERAFDILKVTDDTLTIWRIDPGSGAILTQTYKKH